MLSGTHKDWLIAVAAARAAELRVQRDAAAHIYRAGHPQVLELARQVRIAEQALEQLRNAPDQVAA